MQRHETGSEVAAIDSTLERGFRRDASSDPMESMPLREDTGRSSKNSLCGRKNESPELNFRWEQMNVGDISADIVCA